MKGKKPIRQKPSSTWSITSEYDRVKWHKHYCYHSIFKIPSAANLSHSLKGKQAQRSSFTCLSSWDKHEWIGIIPLSSRLQRQNYQLPSSFAECSPPELWFLGDSRARLQGYGSTQDIWEISAGPLLLHRAPQMSLPGHRLYNPRRCVFERILQVVLEVTKQPPSPSFHHVEKTTCIAGLHVWRRGT